MKATGIVRLVDGLGRIVLPIELRRVLGIEEGTPMEIYLRDKQVMLKKYRGSAACFFCERADGTLLPFKSVLVCTTCIQELDSPIQEVAAGAEQIIEVMTVGSKIDIDESNKTRKRKSRGETAKNLQELMVRNPNASQTELARQIGVTPSYVSLLLKKKMNHNTNMDS